MANKTYRAKLVNNSKEVNSAVERTHYIFVNCLRQMILRYNDMRKGKYGEKCRQLIEIILKKGNTFAHGAMDQITRQEPKTSLDNDWINLCKAIRREKGPIFLQNKEFTLVDGIKIHTKGQGKYEPVENELAVPAKFWHQVCDSASAYIKSFYELLDNWKKERSEWLKKKDKWQEDNKVFMNFWHNQYQKFESECEEMRKLSQSKAGQKITQRKKYSRERGKRISRWHLWYQWVIEHPEVIEWRGKAKKEDFKPVPPEFLEKFKEKSKRQDRIISKCLDWIKDNNPEFKELEDKRKYFVRNYLRFKSPPTFTLPSANKHPYWFTFERKEFYKNADFEKGFIELNLIDKDKNDRYFFKWFKVKMKCDNRLVPSYRLAKYSETGRYPPYSENKIGKTLDRPAKDAVSRRAGYRGAKLYLQAKSKELLFTVVEQDCPPQVRWAKVKKNNCRADNLFGADGKTRIRTRVMGIDLGIRNPACFAIAEGVYENESWKTKIIKKGVFKGRTLPSLFEIRQHDFELRKSRRKKGRAVRGERNFTELQDHRSNMSDDRFKKVSNKIIEKARENDVHLIVFEKLSSLKFTAFDEKWLNRQLRDMNRGHIFEYVKEQSQEFGILLSEISPYFTSQICSECFKPGFRFSIKGKNPYSEGRKRVDCEDYGYPIWDAGGKLFRCPHCGYKTNSDINAASNIVLKFFGQWPRDANYKRKKGVFFWKEGEEKSFDAREEFEKWANTVKLRKAAESSPF